MLNKIINKLLPKEEIDYSGICTKYIHIGYPKCASTTLQIDFFPFHKEILHLGSGFGQSAFGYINDEIHIAVEVDLRYRKSSSYNPGKIKAHFEEQFKIAKDSSKIRAVGISSEAFAFTYGNDIDVKEKCNRLFDIFGSDTKIIMIVRNQKDLYLALYAEHIREGYIGTFKDFLEFSYLFKDRNWFYDFCYNETFQMWADKFGKENVIVLPFEMLKDQSEKFITSLLKSINVSIYEVQLPNRNERLDIKTLSILRNYNLKCLHTLSRDLYHPYHLHRYKPYFEIELKMPIPTWSVTDLHLQLGLIGISENASKTFVNESLSCEEINLNWPEEYYQIFQDTYSKSNKELNNNCQLNLEKYGYWL